MAKKSVTAIVSGAGWIASFADKLICGLRDAGWTDDQIHRLVTDDGEPDMKKIIAGLGRVLRINRSVPFSPAAFIGKDWGFDESEDPRSLALSEVDFTKVRFETSLRDGETRLTGEEKLRRLKESKVIRLDAKAAQAFHEEEGHKTLEWLRKEKGITYLDFFGTVLRSPFGRRFVLYLRWDGGRWGWHFYWLGGGWYEGDPSAVLAS